MTAARPTGPVVALAGRRIDAPDAAPARFPLANVVRVRADLAALFGALRPAALVCSAACGADLLALDEGGHAGLRCRVVLPFDPGRFRRTSVTDRPGDWGPLFDAALRDARAGDDLVVLLGGEEAGQGEFGPGAAAAAYAAATARILDEADQLARDRTPSGGGEDGPAPVAVVVWDGQSRGGEDATAQFASLARERGWAVHEILTQ